MVQALALEGQTTSDLVAAAAAGAAAGAHLPLARAPVRAPALAVVGGRTPYVCLRKARHPKG